MSTRSYPLHEIFVEFDNRIKPLCHTAIRPIYIVIENHENEKNMFYFILFD